jgi:hypothetical protein
MTLSKHERAGAIFAMGIFAAIAFFLVVAGGSVLFMVSKGGIAAYESISARMGSGGQGAATTALR